ncbi:MAG TPA: hypothetical protein VEX62_11605, partial [Candidatus Limnocylindrales bacterium]|nr:hypothetical protein [Candidatus Limnocylindrales bacterium]
PLLAKLMVVAGDRPSALARLRRALDEFEIGGVQTTLPFDRWLLDQPDFIETTGLSTDLVQRLWVPSPELSGPALRAAELAALASLDSQPSASRPPATGANDGAAPAWWQAGIAEATENQP